MARSAAIPLAIAGFGSLILISGIEGQSLSEVIKGEIGKGKEPLNPSGKTSGSGSSVTGEEGIPGGIPGGQPLGPNVAIPPNSVVPPNSRAATLLQKVERGEKFRIKVKGEVEKGEITTRQGSEKFSHRYPNFAEEATELGELLKAIKK